MRSAEQAVISRQQGIGILRLSRIRSVFWLRFSTPASEPIPASTINQLILMARARLSLSGFDRELPVHSQVEGQQARADDQKPSAQLTASLGAALARSGSTSAFPMRQAALASSSSSWPSSRDVAVVVAQARLHKHPTGDEYSAVTVIQPCRLHFCGSSVPPKDSGYVEGVAFVAVMVTRHLLPNFSSQEQIVVLVDRLKRRS